MSEKIKVRVSYSRESEKSFGLIVDLQFNDKGICVGGSRLEWFTKNLCELEIIEVKDHLNEYYLTAPKWLLDNKKVKYEK